MTLPNLSPSSKTTCPQDGQPCECRGDSLSFAHCYSARSAEWIRKTARIVADGKKVMQRQDSADDQWFDLARLAVEFGLYDALDRLRQLQEREVPASSYFNPDSPFGV